MIKNHRPVGVKQDRPWKPIAQAPLCREVEVYEPPMNGNPARIVPAQNVTGDQWWSDGIGQVAPTLYREKSGG